MKFLYNFIEEKDLVGTYPLIDVYEMAVNKIKDFVPEGYKYSLIKVSFDATVGNIIIYFGEYEEDNAWVSSAVSVEYVVVTTIPHKYKIDTVVQDYDYDYIGIGIGGCKLDENAISITATLKEIK